MKYQPWGYPYYFKRMVDNDFVLFWSESRPHYRQATAMYRSYIPDNYLLLRI